MPTIRPMPLFCAVALLLQVAGCAEPTGAAPSPQPASPAAMTQPSEPAVPAIDTAPVFERLAPPRLEADAGPSAFQEAVRPVPRAGERALAFPPPGELQRPPPQPLRAAPLEVTRHQPEGAVEMQRVVSVTFSQAMVPLADVASLRTLPVPLRLEPQPEGSFRWLDATTAIFEAKDRLPYGTRYRATVPAGTRSQGGGVLAQAVSFTFETPRPEVTTFEPNQARDVVQDPVLHLAFNQRVAPQAVAEALRCIARGKRHPLQVEPVPKDELPGGDGSDVEVLRRQFLERNVFLRPVEKLPQDADVTCTLPKGFVGLEGKEGSAKDQPFTFRTYGKLAVKSVACRWGKECPPGTPLAVVLTNRLSPDQDLSTLVDVRPAVEDLVRTAQQSFGEPTVVLEGNFAAETTYTITVRAALRDVHGQTLGHDVTHRVTIGPAQPLLDFAGALHQVVERFGPRLLPLTQTAVSKARLRYFKLQPAELPAALEDASRYPKPDEDPFASRTPAIDRTLDLGARRNDARDRGLDLDEALGQGKGGLVLVDISSSELKRADRTATLHRWRVVQVTDLGVTAHLTEKKAAVLVTSFRSGKPVAGARVRLITRPGATVAEARTDAHGLCELPAPPQRPGVPHFFVAETDDDAAVLPSDSVSTGQYISSFARGEARSAPPTLLSSVFTDRSPYRPGDTVHIAGVLRSMTHGPRGGLLPLAAGSSFTYRVADARGQKLAEGAGEVSALGMFSVEVALPKDAALGRCSFQATLRGGGFSESGFGTSFSVEEFRTPEYTVAVETGSAPHLTRETLRGAVVGSYYFGGGMAGAEAELQVTRSEASFTPPGAPAGFSFGKQPDVIPFFMGLGRRGGYEPPAQPVDRKRGTLDAQGRLPFEVALDPGALEGPLSFTFEGTVTDASRQAITTRQVVLAHAARDYVGVRLDRTVLKAGESLGVELLALDLDGKPLPTSGVTVELIRRTWERDPKGFGPGTSQEKVAATCTPSAPARPGDAATCRLPIAEGGDYTLRSTIRDAQGRTNVTSLRVYVVGEGQRPWGDRGSQGTVELIPDAKSFAPGSTARVLIKSPFPRSVGFLAIDREGLVELRPLTLEGPTSMQEIALPAELVPNVHVMVGLVRGRISPEEAGAAPGDPDDLGRPMYAGASTALRIALTEHQLHVAVKPARPAIAPGEQLDLEIHTTDSAGKGRAAELVVAVVDEGVLALEGYALPDPLEALFPERQPEAGISSQVPLVISRQAKLERVPPPSSPPAPGGARRMMAMAPPAAPVQKPMASMDMEGEGGVAPAFAARSVFASTAYFSASVRTDAEGKATLSVKMPENLTRYRVMVVGAADGERFGTGDGSVTLRKPLLIRPALPRFLNLGDTFQAAAVINNQTESDLWVDAQARAANGSVDARRQRVLVRAGASQEVHFDARAGTPGPSKWQLAAVALDRARSSDAAELVVPVKLPATAEAFATYGSTEENLLQPVALPKDALPDFGGLEVSLSSTALTSLSDAVVYLHEYPYECVEQTASRILPLIVLKPVIRDFHIAGAGTEAQRDAQVQAGIKKILGQQRQDGGFGFWVDSRESSLFVSAWVAQVFARARAQGDAVDGAALGQLVAYLGAQLEATRKKGDEERNLPAQALAAKALGELGKPAPAAVKRLYGQRQELPLFAQAWLLDAAARAFGPTSSEASELLRGLRNAAVEKAATVHFAERKTESLRLLMHSSDRTDAIVLGALIHVAPQDPLVLKVVRGLDVSRRRGRWDTTQSNAWALMAMADYYAAFEKTVPGFTAELFVGQAFGGESRFEGRSAEVVTRTVPMAVALQQQDPALTLAKQGPGKLYYRLGLRYAPRSLVLPAEEQGFTVRRTYEPMPDAPGTVTTGPDGHVLIRAGSEVRVTLQVVVTDRSAFVAVDDPLPAGLEAVNTSFLTAQSKRLQDAEDDRSEHARPPWFWPIWNPFNHTELRDDRVALFADWLPAGVYTHSYVARATTRGVFQVPPLRAFEMYAPESFGHTASTVVEVQ